MVADSKGVQGLGFRVKQVSQLQLGLQPDPECMRLQTLAGVMPFTSLAVTCILYTVQLADTGVASCLLADVKPQIIIETVFSQESRHLVGRVVIRPVLHPQQ